MIDAMNIKMIVTDLDGTLIGSDGSVSERTKEVLRSCKKQGILVVIATGRCWIEAENYIEEIRPDHEITTDGTLIHEQGKEIYSCSFTAEAANKILRDLLAYNAETEVFAAAGRQVFWNSDRISESQNLHKAVYHSFQKPLDRPVNKLVARLPSYEEARRIADGNSCRLITYRGEDRYAFLPKNAGKAQAIKELARSLDISPNEIAAFGDDKNDLDMLRFSGIGVAVANAVAEVKETADDVTASNDENGVAEWLAKNVLRQSSRSPI